MSKPQAWQCDICGKESFDALVGVGAYCSRACKKELIKRAKEEEAELLAEPIEEAPELFDIQAFERFILKIALHMIRDLPKNVRADWKKNNSPMLSASNLALEIKERTIKHIPLFYISFMQAEGREKLFYGGSFEFKAKVPKKVILEALVKAKVFKANDGV